MLASVDYSAARVENRPSMRAQLKITRAACECVPTQPEKRAPWGQIAVVSRGPGVSMQVRALASHDQRLTLWIAIGRWPGGPATANRDSISLGELACLDVCQEVAPLPAGEYDDWAALAMLTVSDGNVILDARHLDARTVRLTGHCFTPESACEI